ncbi:MAG: CDP-diacylglycerol--glycerol-3-phosphate 3-phosphatidyltransferase [Propionibacteriaceae bacterium]|jgi:CDP-diacylglycerol--glycerol-3-phosphate 3-phosphatidyltransferase|nr:CDP-diacylglycerol--glycerol-3-phosphate 3-phosphatidyltransferase [Propionibacteriaceae bacterium]
MTDEAQTAVPVVNVPNALTLLRLLLVPVFGWMLLAHPDDVGWRWLSTAVFAVALATDFADGQIARRYHLITNFGKLWDPIADKAITGMGFIGLSLLGELWWWVTIVILVREWGITLLRFLILKYGVMAANRGGKLKTLTQTAALLVCLAPLPTLFYWPAVVLMALAFVLTVVTGVDYLIEAYRLRARWLAERSAAS